MREPRGCSLHMAYCRQGAREKGWGHIVTSRASTISVIVKEGSDTRTLSDESTTVVSESESHDTSDTNMHISKQ